LVEALGDAADVVETVGESAVPGVRVAIEVCRKRSEDKRVRRGRRGRQPHVRL
jgi:hypothetical protein